MTDVLTQNAPEETAERLVPGLGDEPTGAGPEVAGPAPLRRVRAGRNTAFDRLVFDLDGPVPGVRVQYVPELRHEGTGDLIPLRGRAVVQVDLAPAAAH